MLAPEPIPVVVTFIVHRAGFLFPVAAQLSAMRSKKKPSRNGPAADSAPDTRPAVALVAVDLASDSKLDVGPGSDVLEPVDDAG